MLQFFLSSSSLNINSIIDQVVGLRAYNSPILFFIAVIGLVYYRGFGLRLQKDMISFVGVVAAIGMFAALTDGFTAQHGRQITVLAIAATCWIFVYELSLRNDIMTLRNTQVILGVYAVYLVVVMLEHQLTGGSQLAFAVSSIFAPYSVTRFGGYVAAGRLPYFSSEPSMAACAVAGCIMPFIAADLRVNPSIRTGALFVLTCVVMFFAEGMTSRLLIAYSLLFIVMGEWAIAPVLGLMGSVAVFAFFNREVVVDRSLFTNLLWGAFGGRSDRIDDGLRSGSYVSRLFNWFLGMRAFLDAPLLGHGLGGTGAYLLRSVGSGEVDTLVTLDQDQAFRGLQAAGSAQMMLRIPAELGMVGTVYILSRARKALRLIFDRSSPDVMTRTAFAYVSGAMLVIFILDGTLLNSVIPCFIVLLGQLRRKNRLAQPALVRAAPASPRVAGCAWVGAATGAD